MKKKLLSMLLAAAITIALIPVSATALAAGTHDVIDKVLASDGAANNEFGYAVAISGDIMVVGAPDMNGLGPGSAYVYDLSQVDVSATEMKLTASDGAAWDRYGFSVAISGDIVVIGAWMDFKGAAQAAGSVYIYDLSSGTGSQADVLASEMKLQTSDGAAWDDFGWSVDISGDIIVAGAPVDDDGGNSSGSAYVYDLSNGTGSQADVLASEMKLTASDGTALSEFGYSVAISGDMIVAGAPDRNGGGTGSAYTYDLSNGTGSKVDVLASEIKLTASDGAAGGYYGISVAISGDKAIAGAPRDDDDGTLSGTAFVYDLSNGTGSKADVLASETKLTASDGAMGHEFGHSVAISGDKIVAGAYGDDNPDDSGSVYVYDLSQPGSEEKLTASNGSEDDQFGFSVAATADKVIAGAHWYDNNGDASGSVYYGGTKYAVALDWQGGTGTTPTALPFYTYPMPSAGMTAPTREGYNFDGYYFGENAAGTKYYHADMTSAAIWDIASDTTIYASWVGYDYTVSYFGNGNDGGIMADQSFVYGTAEKLNANKFTKTDYILDGWAISPTGVVVFEDKESVNHLTTSEFGNVKLYAKWILSEYNVTLNNLGGSGSSAVTATYDSPMPSGVSAPRRSGYRFMGYYKNINEENTKYYNADMSSAKDWDMASDCTLYAKWAVRPPAFTVSFDTQGGGSVSSQQVTDGDYAAKPFTDPTKSGYAFGGWYTDSACSADNRWNFNACPIIRDTTLYAKWTAEPVPTPSPSASEAPAPSPSVAAAPGSLGSIIPKTVERNKETGMTTIAIDVSDLPEGTTAIETPGGEVLYVSDAKDGVLIFEVNEDDVDANGEIEIVALDGEMTPIAKVRVRVPEENETPVIANTGEPDEPGVNIWLIVAIILAGLIVLGGIASIIIWRRKQQAQR